MNDVKMLHMCDKCNKTFRFKSDYDRHVNRKISCVKEEKTDYYQQKKICNYCNKTLSRSDALSKHMITCKMKNKKEVNIENNREINNETTIEKLMKEMQELKKENEVNKELQKDMQQELTRLKEEIVKSQTGNVKNINIGKDLTNNIQNNIHNEIKIIAYGKEDTSYITDNEYETLINKGFKSVPNLVEFIHFNENKPENQNVYISNMRDNYVLVYDGEQWLMREREDVLQDMIDNKTDILNEKFDELLDKLDEITVRKFKRFLDEKDTNKVSAQLKTDLKLMLYNRKKVTSVKPRIGGAVKLKSSTEQIKEQKENQINEHNKSNNENDMLNQIKPI